MSICIPPFAIAIVFAHTHLIITAYKNLNEYETNTLLSFVYMYVITLPMDLMNENNTSSQGVSYDCEHIAYVQRQCVCVCAILRAMELINDYVVI